MIKIPPKYHPAYIPALASLVSILVICILVLAAYANSTTFWITAILIDMMIIYIGFTSIVNLRKPKYMSKPLGRVLEFSVKESIEQQEET